MKANKIVWIVLSFLLFSVHPVQAGSSVWKVENGDNHLYIGGTVHILSESDYPLPSTFDRSYAQSTLVVFETDIQQFKSPEFQSELVGKVMYTDGRNLKTVLNKATFNSLERHLSKRGIPIEGLIGFKPGMLSATLMVLEIQRLGLMGSGVDEHYSYRAIYDRKVLGHLETAEEQLTFISTLGEGKENEFVEYSLRDLDKMPSLLKSIKDGWRRGDNQQLENVALMPLKKEFPEMYQQIIVKRNNAWIPKIEEMLQTREVELVLVGVLHLVGDDGLISRLSARGYQVRPE